MFFNDVMSVSDIIEVMPNIFVGTANATESHILEQFNIQCVLNVATRRENFNQTHVKFLKTFLTSSKHINSSLTGS